MEADILSSPLLVSLVAMIFPFLMHLRWPERILELERKRVEDRAGWTHPDGCPVEAEAYYALQAFLRSARGSCYKASGWTMALAGAFIGNWHGSVSLALGAMAAWTAAFLAAVVALIGYANRGP